MGAWDFLSANWWKIGGLGVGYFVVTGRDPMAMVPTLPEWTGLVVMAAVGAVVVGSVASGRIHDLLPEAEKVSIVVVNARKDPPVEVHRVTPDKWAATEVVAGSVMPLATAASQAFLAYEYDPSANVVVGTWLESKNEAEFVGHHEASDALEAIAEVRDALEPMAQRGQRIQQFLPSIVRDLDRKRAQNQNAALAGHTAPSIGDGDDDTIQSAIERHVPEDLRPERMTAGDAEQRDAASEGGEFVGMDLLDDEEALAPRETLRNDGGSQ